MREPPADLADADVLTEVRRSWDVEVDRLVHLPVGFGAHHWVAGATGVARHFVTLDRLEPKRTSDNLEAAYAGAAALCDAGLEFVLAGLPARQGTYIVPFADSALSLTPWRGGASPELIDSSWTAEALRRLHSTAPPQGLPRWQPLVAPEFADECSALVRAEWGPGPYAERARLAVAARLAEIAGWTVRYHHLAQVAAGRTWVATHGEPHADNQLVAADGAHLLVDWESLKLAPAELDLRALPNALDAGADPEMLELFDLEWRLDEIGQYAAWFAAPHAGTADDDIAFGGLLHELIR